jgi:hypothetical protein
MSKSEEIKKAFSKLAADPSKKITPSMVAKEAKVSRATFYNTYDNYEDLLFDYYNDLRQKFITDGSFTLDIFLSFLKENRAFFIRFLDSCPFTNLLADFLGPQDYGNLDATNSGSRYQAAYEISGINGILFTWAANECSTPVRVIRRAIIANQDIEEYPSSRRFILCDVNLYSERSDRSFTLSYLSNNPHIKPDDDVLVPLGQDNHLVYGTVERVRLLTEKELPLPLYKIKYIAKGPVPDAPPICLAEKYYDNINPCGNPKL